MPGSQGTHAEAFLVPFIVWPLGHEMHSAIDVAPGLLLNLPEGHDMHGELPSIFLYLPGSQDTQAVPFDVSPLRHGTQFRLLPPDKEL